MHFLKHDKKAFHSSILKHRLSHTDKTDPNNIQLPPFIEKLNKRKLKQIIQKIIKKYKQKNYTLFNREELNSDKNWHDTHFIILFMYYKKHWSLTIDNDDIRFPHFLTTYNLEPLQEEVDKTISKIYDKIDSKATKDNLNNSYTYTALDLTYILYYLSITVECFEQHTKENND